MKRRGFGFVPPSVAVPQRRTLDQMLAQERRQSEAKAANVAVASQGDRGQPLATKDKALPIKLSDHELERRRQVAITRPIPQSTQEVIAKGLQMSPETARIYVLLMRNSRACRLPTDRSWLDVYTNTLSMRQVLGMEEAPPVPTVAVTGFTPATGKISHLAHPPLAAAEYAEAARGLERALEELTAAEYARPKAPPWWQVQTWVTLPGPEVFLDLKTALSIGLFLDDKERFAPTPGKGFEVLREATEAVFAERFPEWAAFGRALLGGVE